MKAILLVSIPFMLVACATQPSRPRMAMREVPGTVLPSDRIESVRYAENIKSYPVGRYVDPGNSRIMHQEHTIYRVETTPKWNLHPNGPASIPLGPITGIRDSATRTSPVANELVAELNRQKEATKTVIQGGQIVSHKLGELTTTLEKSQQVAAQNVQLKQEVDSTKRRLDALEEELRRQPAVAPAAPNPARIEESQEW
ncbi:MAG: hypothetical protein ABI680_16555 [Chthoniobacteraceae bacterium]